MNETAGRAQKQWLVPLILGDIVVFLIFAYIGKSAHAHSIDPLGLFITAAPFLISWLAIGSFMGVYKPQAYESIKQSAKKTAIVWTIACLVGHTARSLTLGKGIDPVFLLITFISVMILMQIWRLGFTWMLARKR
ncbi:MAG: DUF3054 domain-containing protein [Clostridia bacterium]